MKTTIFDFVRDYIYIILGIVCVIIVGIIYIFATNRPSSTIEPANVIYTHEAEAYQLPDVAEEIEDVFATIIVHIVGEVNNPQVLELPYGARVNDALQMAGGATEYADLSRVNLAAVLRDAMQVVIPAIGDDTADVFVYDGVQPQAAATGLININTATAAELQTLPGIGPARAQSIIDLRESMGGFTAIEDLLRVSGIGTAIFEGLRDMVIVN